MRVRDFITLAALPLAACAATGPAPAPTDFEAMSAASREIHCVAWVWIGGNVALERGEISQRDLNETGMSLAHEIQDQGDNRRYGAEFRRVDAAIDAIVASEPSEAEAQEAIAYCREYLRL